MTTEPGSDELLAELADPTAIDARARAQAARLAVEEARVSAAPQAGVEPGADHPAPDETPAGAPPEYDPLPPAG